jgi:hypothetical protein
LPPSPGNGRFEAQPANDIFHGSVNATVGDQISIYDDAAGAVQVRAVETPQPQVAVSETLK